MTVTIDVAGLDFDRAARALIKWYRRAGRGDQLSSSVQNARDLTVLRRAHRLARPLSFDGTDYTVRTPPTRDDFLESPLWLETYQAWYEQYFVAAWERHLVRIAKLLLAEDDEARRGPLLRSRLRQQVERDLLDLARSLDTVFELAQQKVNTAIRRRGYARARLFGRQWVANVGRDPRQLAPVDEADERAVRTAIPAGAPVHERGQKLALALFWLEHWFATVPERRVLNWQLTHEMIDAFQLRENVNEASTPSELSDARRARVTREAEALLRILEQQLGTQFEELTRRLTGGRWMRELGDMNDHLTAAFDEVCEDLDDVPTVLEIARAMLAARGRS